MEPTSTPFQNEYGKGMAPPTPTFPQQSELGKGKGLGCGPTVPCCTAPTVAHGKGNVGQPDPPAMAPCARPLTVFSEPFRQQHRPLPPGPLSQGTAAGSAKDAVAEPEREPSHIPHVVPALFKAPPEFEDVVIEDEDPPDPPAATWSKRGADNQWAENTKKYKLDHAEHYHQKKVQPKAMPTTHKKDAKEEASAWEYTESSKSESWGYSYQSENRWDGDNDSDW